MLLLLLFIFLEPVVSVNTSQCYGVVCQGLTIVQKFHNWEIIFSWWQKNKILFYEPISFFRFLHIFPQSLDIIGSSPQMEEYLIWGSKSWLKKSSRSKNCLKIWWGKCLTIIMSWGWYAWKCSYVLGIRCGLQSSRHVWILVQLERRPNFCQWH